MYVVPSPAAMARVYVERIEVEKLNGICQRERERFLVRRTCLGGLSHPDELANCVRTTNAVSKDRKISVDVLDRVFDGDSGGFVERMQTYSY